MRAGLREQRVWLPAALVALPLTVYLLAYAPFFSMGFGFGEFLEP